MIAQDSSDPTGVAVVDGRSDSPAVYRARNRKAKAALALYLEGGDWRQVAKVGGYPTPRLAKVAVEQMLEKQLDQVDKAHLRLKVSGQLDTLLRSVMPKAKNPDNPEHLAAVQRSREIIADYRKMWGIDAPQEVLITSPTQRDLDQWVGTVLAGSLPSVEDADIVDAEEVIEFDMDEEIEPDAVPD